MWSADDGGPSSEVLPPETAAETTTIRAEDWDNPGAAESDDGGLSAPIVYASLVLGMITMFKSAGTAVSDSAWDVPEKGHGEESSGVSVGALPAEGESEESPKAVWGERVSGSGCRKACACEKGFCFCARVRFGGVGGDISHTWAILCSRNSEEGDLPACVFGVVSFVHRNISLGHAHDAASVGPDSGEGSSRPERCPGTT